MRAGPPGPGPRSPGARGPPRCLGAEGGETWEERAVNQAGLERLLDPADRSAGRAAQRRTAARNDFSSPAPLRPPPPFY